MSDVKNCPFLPQETRFTAFLSRMSRESQHTRFEDQIIPDICHFFYTGKIFRDTILHPEARK